MPVEAMRKLFLQIVLALGFERGNPYVGVYTGIRINEDIFLAGKEHSRVAELLIHFLLDIIDSRRCKQLFVSSFPVCDSRQAREFRTIAFKWMDELKRDDSNKAIWPKWSHVRRSFFDECMGYRFENMVWGLAVAASSKYLLLAAKRTGFGNSDSGGNLDANIRYILGLPVIESQSKTQSQTRTTTGNQLEKINHDKAEIAKKYVVDIEDRKTALGVLNDEIVKIAVRKGNIKEYRNSTEKDSMAEISKLISMGITFSQSPTLPQIQKQLDVCTDQIRNLVFKPATWINSQSENVDAIQFILGFLSETKDDIELDANRDLPLLCLQDTDNKWTQWLQSQSVRPYVVDPSDQKLKLDLISFLKLSSACLTFVLSQEERSEGQNIDSSTVEKGITQPKLYNINLSATNGSFDHFSTNNNYSSRTQVSSVLDQIDTRIIKVNERIDKLLSLKAKLLQLKTKKKNISTNNKENENDARNSNIHTFNQNTNCSPMSLTEPKTGPIISNSLTGSSASNGLSQKFQQLHDNVLNLNNDNFESSYANWASQFISTKY